MSNKTKNKGLNQQGNYIYMLIGLLILIIIGPTLSHEIESGAQIITQLCLFLSCWLECGVYISSESGFELESGLP